MSTRTTIHHKVTEQILEAMKNSTGFKMPWHTDLGIPTNVVTSKSYNGINTVSLWCTAMQRGYGSGTWATYKQWQSVGAQVQRGEKGSSIVIYKPLKEEETNGADDNDQRLRVLIKSATVFNANQVTGWEGKGDNLPTLSDQTEQLKTVDTFVANTQATIKTGGTKAYYSPAQDLIAMPDRELFIGTDTSSPTEAYYSTLLHELAHWTGSKDRCNRDLSGRFGSNSYAMEELVAELGAAFLCADLNVTSMPRQDHADYLNNWIKVLKEDERAIFWAAARASEAGAYLNTLQVPR